MSKKPLRLILTNFDAYTGEKVSFPVRVVGKKKIAGTWCVKLETHKHAFWVTHRDACEMTKTNFSLNGIPLLYY